MLAMKINKKEVLRQISCDCDEPIVYIPKQQTDLIQWAKEKLVELNIKFTVDEVSHSTKVMLIMEEELEEFMEDEEE